MDEIDTPRPKRSWVKTILIVVAIIVGALVTLVAVIVRLSSMV